MAKQPNKQTSARISSIAAKYVGDQTPLGDVSEAIGKACRECGVPLNDRAVLALTNRLESALAPVLNDLRSLAASCLSQDETPAVKADKADAAWTNPADTIAVEASEDDGA